MYSPVWPLSRFTQNFRKPSSAVSFAGFRDTPPTPSSRRSSQPSLSTLNCSGSTSSFSLVHRPTSSLLNAPAVLLRIFGPTICCEVTLYFEFRASLASGGTVWIRFEVTCVSTTKTRFSVASFCCTSDSIWHWRFLQSIRLPCFLLEKDATSNACAISITSCKVMSPSRESVFSLQLNYTSPRLNIWFRCQRM